MVGNKLHIPLAELHLQEHGGVIGNGIVRGDELREGSRQGRVRRVWVPVGRAHVLLAVRM